MATLYVKRKQRIHGPFSMEQIMYGLENQQLRDSDLISTSQNGPWQTFDGYFLQPKDGDEIEEAQSIDSIPNNAEAADVQEEQSAQDPQLTAEQKPSVNHYREQSHQLGNSALIPFDCPICGARLERKLPICPQCGSALGIQAKFAKFVKNASKHAKKAIDDAVAETLRAIDEKDTIVVHDTVVFGRSADLSDWVIPDPEVSPTHAQVVRRDKRLTLTDLKTRTGTFVNGSLLPANKPHELQNDDCIQIGSASFLVSGTTLVSTQRN